MSEGGREPDQGRPAGRGLWALGAVLLVVQAAAVAAVFMPAPHTGGDNAGYLILGRSLAEYGEYLDLWAPGAPHHTKYPPVYPALLGVLILLGARTWITFKALSGVLILAAVALAYLWAADRRGAVFALGVGLILALSDSFLWHSHWVLSDPLFLALTLAALWAFQRAAAREDSDPSTWIALGAAAAILAFFTRSAGLPLAAAVLVWLALRRRFAWLAGFAAALGVPAALWWLRASRTGDPSYVSEFRLVDPYDPSRGTADLGDFARRIWENFGGYVGDWIPGGITGLRGAPVAAVGVLLLALAVVGWLRRVRAGATVAELFTPLYLGLILLWPEVWSGDRFALPLLPLLLFYAGETWVDGAAHVLSRRAGLLAGAVGVAALAVPAATVAWRGSADAAECWRIARAEGPFACYGRRYREFVEAAEFGRAWLPPDAHVFSRKPRIFYLLSGIPGDTYPLSPDPAGFLAAAREKSIDWVVLDYVDHLGTYYVVPVVRARPGAFCTLVGFGDAGGVRTEILGIETGAGAEGGGAAMEPDGTVVVDLAVCDPERLREAPRERPDYSVFTIPLLSEPALPLAAESTP